MLAHSQVKATGQSVSLKYGETKINDMYIVMVLLP